MIGRRVPDNSRIPDDGSGGITQGGVFSPPPPGAHMPGPPDPGGMPGMPPGGISIPGMPGGGDNPPNDLPSPGGDTTPDVHRPGDTSGPGSRDRESPIEQHPGAPGPGGGNGGMQTPAMPMNPTPIAGQAPQPFTPIPSPVMAGGVQRVTPSLYGKAGGLLGGGIGVQDAGNSSLDANNPDILRLLQLLGVK